MTHAAGNKMERLARFTCHLRRFCSSLTLPSRSKNLNLNNSFAKVHDVKLEKLTAAWLLPVVPAVVCGASGGIVASVLAPDRAQITLLVSYVLWGFGMLLAVLVMALYFHRLAIHKLPNSEVKL